MDDMLQIQITHPSRELRTIDASYGAYMIGSDSSSRIVLDVALQRLERAIESLDGAQREVLLLRKLEELSFKGSDSC